MTTTPAPEPTDAEIVAAIRRGIELGTIVEVTPELLAQMAAADEPADEPAPTAVADRPEYAAVDLGPQQACGACSRYYHGDEHDCAPIALDLLPCGPAPQDVAFNY